MLELDLLPSMQQIIEVCRRAGFKGAFDLLIRASIENQGARFADVRGRQSAYLANENQMVPAIVASIVLALE